MGFVPIIAGVMSGVSTIIGGLAQKSQADAEAAQYRQNAQNALTAGDQQDAARRADLISTLSSVDAIRTARGLDVASPTGLAIASDYTTRAERAINVTRANAFAQAGADRTAAGIASSQGNAAMITGFLKGGQSLFSAGRDAYNYFG